MFKKKSKEKIEDVENSKKSARDIDKTRVQDLKKKKKSKEKKEKKVLKVKRTTINTIPYECFVSDQILLLKSNVRVGSETANLYSKTYPLLDINYSSLDEESQLEKMQLFIDMLNGFDSTISIQFSIINNKVNIRQFEDTMLVKDTKEDKFVKLAEEYNDILGRKFIKEKNGLICKKYITITVLAVDFNIAADKFFNIEAHMLNCLSLINSKMYEEFNAMNANERVRLLADIYRDPNYSISTISKKEFDRQEEKQLCSPDYFEFKKDYFMFNEKYARCMYFRRLPSSISDTIYKELTALNLETIITENIEFVDPDEAVKLIQRKMTDMRQEEIIKTKNAILQSKGAYVDPITGTQLEADKEHAAELLHDIQQRNQKMMLCQFIIVIIAGSYEELEKNTDAINTVLKKYQIISINAPYRQEQSFASALPLGNSMSYDKERNLQVRRTLTSESTAVFMPFNEPELMHENGIFYGQNKISKNAIVFDRRRLNNPNGFIFGVPGSGKGVTAKNEIISSALTTNEEIIILDPEREYVELVKLLGGEVINISENSKTYINPMDIINNPDKDDSEYDPIKAKFDFLLSFFSDILGNIELSPIHKTIIDNVMRNTYDQHKEPTLKEFYDELEIYENGSDSEIKGDVAYLRETLHLYVFGSMNVFAKKSNVDINKRIVVYDIKDLGKNMQSLGMMVVLENIWNRIAYNRSKKIGTRVYIDEMYLMFKSEQASTFFYELYKRARKWGGIPTGITQNVDDLLKSENARTMISNTDFIIMLAQNATDRVQLSSLCKIPTDTMKYVTNSKPGTGLIYAGEFGIIPFENEIPKDTEIYKVISTRFGE